MLALKFQVFLMRLFGCIKTACANAFAVNHNLRQPFSLVSANPQKTSFIGFSCYSHILQITKSSYFPKIAKSIIRSLPIYVVNMFRGLVACYVQPRKPMCKPFLIKYCNAYVSSAMFTSGYFSIWERAAKFLTPHKNTRSWVITQYFSKIFSRNKFCRHEIPLLSENEFTIHSLRGTT